MFIYINENRLNIKFMSELRYVEQLKNMSDNS